MVISEKIQFISEISNILACYKAHAELSTSALNNHQKLLNLIVVLLESYTSSYAKEISDKTENGLSLLHFIFEQLEMFHPSKTG